MWGHRGHHQLLRGPPNIKLCISGRCSVPPLFRRGRVWYIADILENSWAPVAAQHLALLTALWVKTHPCGFLCTFLCEALCNWKYMYKGHFQASTHCCGFWSGTFRTFQCGKVHGVGRTNSAWIVNCPALGRKRGRYGAPGRTGNW